MDNQQFQPAENSTQNQVDEQPVLPKSNKKLIAVIVIVIVLLGLGAGAYWYFTKAKPVACTQEAKQCSDGSYVSRTGPNCEFAECPSTNQSPSALPDVTDGQILFIREGDIWISKLDGREELKLADVNNAIEAQLSPDKNFIAYTLKAERDEQVKDVENQPFHTEKITRFLLYIADRQGSNSVLVKDPVDVWGWIESSNMLWYESASLGMFFGWGFLGDGKLYIYDPTIKKSIFINDFNTENICSFSFFYPEWSSDGNKLVCIGPSRESGASSRIQVFDIETHKSTTLIDIPYIGGDRGGPAPVPAYYWSPDNKYIYTIFTPLLTSWTGADNLAFKEYKTGYVHVYKITVATGEKEMVAPLVPSMILNEERFPQGNFSIDFKKVVYPRFKDADIQGLTSEQWAGYGSVIEQNEFLAIYDITTGKETIMDFKTSPWNLNYNYSENSQNFEKDGIISFFVRKNNQIYRLRLDLNNGQINEYLLQEVSGKEPHYDTRLSNIYQISADVFYFVYRDKVYRLENNNMLPVIENISSARFYIEK